MELSPISLRYIADLLEERTGQQLSEGRHWRIGTALSGIFRERGISNVDQLVCLLAQPEERELEKQVVEALLNNETYFYRDRAMFDLLTQQVLPDIARRRREARRISIWSAGCSLGQEALSIAMLFLERAEKWSGWQIEILGTDISEKAIATARLGCYSQFEIQRGLGIAQMLSFFEETSEGWQAKDKLRRMVQFEVHNIHDPLPSSRNFDLVLCRNVLLYFSPATRSKVFDRIASVISQEGWLMLGAGETVVGQTDRFVPAKGNQGLYRPAGCCEEPVTSGELLRAP
jgi:chemotaxis protein methyltransferase CheR